jgi:septal ring factor EnvC (AmiA/AmiB activator)
VQQIQAEIEAIRSQIESLRQERAALIVEHVALPEDNSPQAIAQAYRRYARETAQLSAEIKGIDDAIAALSVQLNQKQSELAALQIESIQKSIEQQVEEGKNRAKVHAERINQLAAELAEELRALKAAADELIPSYWQVYYKPFITGFQTISVPHVRSDRDVWTIVNRVV